jgi:Lrp/AsnC family leucine-responsive transcriptional regulator
MVLKQDSRLTNKEIGQRVHRTGQAVGARIAQLMDARKLALMLS